MTTRNINLLAIPTMFGYNAAMQSVRIIILTICFLTLLLVSANGEPNTQLSPQQQDTVRLFLKTPFPRYACLSDNIYMPMSQVMADIVKNIDPILVSKHFIFTKDWLEFIGDDKGKQVTWQQFKKWTESLDQLFECYEEFMGQKPFETDVLLINLHTPNNPSKSIAHAYMRIICINSESGNPFDNLLMEIRHRGTPGYLMLHELAHCFSKGGPLAQKQWTGEMETVADFLISYALEKGGIEFGSPAITGKRHRESLLKVAMEHLENGTIKPFTYEHGSGYDLYMLGIVDVVGWDTLKRTIQSYRDSSYTPTKVYDDSRSTVVYLKHQMIYRHRIHEFFDRVAHFHDEARELAKIDSQVLQSIPTLGRTLTGEDALRSLHDEGWFLDHHFTVKTTPTQNKKNQR